MYWLIYDWNSACDHIKIEMDCLNFLSDLCNINWQWIDCIFYYYVHRYNGSSRTRWLFENRDFVWRILRLLSIVEVDRFLVTWKRWTGFGWACGTTFLGQLKKIGCWKGSRKIKYCNLCTKLNVCRKYQGKKICLNLKLG